MQCAVLIYESEQDIADRPSLMPAYAAYSQALTEAGHMAGGEARQPTHPAPPCACAAAGARCRTAPSPTARNSWAASS